jgi:hypothetical protein
LPGLRELRVKYVAEYHTLRWFPLPWLRAVSLSAACLSNVRLDGYIRQSPCCSFVVALTRVARRASSHWRNEL